MTDRDLGYDLDVDALVARGLARYRAGDVDGALTAWEHVLAIDPGEPRALGYVDYVRQNYDELVGRETPMAEMLIPFGLGRGDDDDYEISISRDDGAPPPERAPEPSVDDGWGLDADQQPSWLDRAAMVATEIELEAEEPSEEESGRRPTAPLGQGSFEDERTRDFLDARRAQLLPFDFGPEPSQGGEPTISRLPVAPAHEPSGESTADVPVPAAEESGDSTLDFGLARNDFGPDFTGERTTERSAARLAPEVLRSLGIAPPGERPATSDEETRQHWPRATDLELAPGAPHDPASELAIEPLEPLPEPERGDRGERYAGFAEAGTVELKRRSAADDDRNPVEVEDLLLPPPGASTSPVDDDTGDTGGRHRPLPVEEALTAGLSAVIDEGASPTEAPDARARRRISALLERAQVASRADEHAVAVAAIDLALSEAPDLASAQKLVHRSRDAILDCYYRFFGDLARRPYVVETYDALTRRALDPRAAFLLSRIDGTLSFEDILDVAGMGRLEACRHLAHLLWRGIIEARPVGA